MENESIKIVEKRNGIHKDSVVRKNLSNHQKSRMPEATRGAEEAGSLPNFTLEVNGMPVGDTSGRVRREKSNPELGWARPTKGQFS